MRWLALLLATLTAVPAAARSQLARAEAWKRVAQTERVTYFGRSRRDVDVKRSEKLLDRLEEVFGPMPRGSRLQYYRHASSAGVQEQTGLYALGVTEIETGRIDSTLAFHPHELVHAVAGRVGRPPLFFEEGLAVALTSEGRWGTRDVDAVARAALASGVRLEPFLERFTDHNPDLAYALAGSFVAYLIDAHGIDAVRTFFAACGASPLRPEGAFYRAFGRTVASASVAWRAALARGESASWRWVEPASWPGSLQCDLARAGATPAIARWDKGEGADVPRGERGDDSVHVGDTNAVAAER